MYRLRSLFNLFYPKNITCSVCGGEIADDTRYGICADCRPKPIIFYCKICGIEIEAQKNYCDYCLTGNRKFDAARAPFCMKEPTVSRLIHGLKYGDKTYLAPQMAEFMSDTLYCQNWNPDVITHVPVHRRKRIFVRGYDQAELIAKELAILTKIPHQRLLVKLRYNRKNAAKLGKYDRQHLLENSFSAFSNVKKMSILLVDDVYTTGSTTEECARVLKEAGAKNVWVLTFATTREIVRTFDPNDGDKRLSEFIKAMK